jgi:hypothetical protein
VENNPVNSSDPLGLDGSFMGVSSGGPYPTGGGGGGWWNGGLSIGPFTFSFGFGSGFAPPFIPWFPLPINTMMLQQQQKQMQQPNLPKIQEPKPAQTFVVDVAEGVGKEIANQGIDLYNFVIFSSRGPEFLYKRHYEPDNSVQAETMDLFKFGSIVIGPGKFLKGLLSGASLTRMSPFAIRFSQPTVSQTFSDGRTIQSTMKALQSGETLVDDIPVIRVVDYNGQVFTLDNRRLVAFQSAGVDSVPVQFVSLGDAEIAKKFIDRFNPVNNGMNIVITQSSKKGRKPAEKLLKKYGKIN